MQNRMINPMLCYPRYRASPNLYTYITGNGMPPPPSDAQARPASAKPLGK